MIWEAKRQHSTSQKPSLITPVHNLAWDRACSSQARIRYFTFGIFTILPFACGSFGSFTTVTYNSFSPSAKATFVVPSPAAISNTCRSLPSGDIFRILLPNHWATERLLYLSCFMLSRLRYSH